MKSLSILVLTIFAIAACKGPKEDSPIDAHFSPDRESKAAIMEDCFQYVSGKDTIRMRIQPDEFNVTGELSFLFFEKDKSKGLIKGTLKDSMLIAEYSFFSEGDSSKRQVVFKRFEEGWREGFGEVEEVDGIVVYQNIDSLDFNHQVNLVSMPCDQFPSSVDN